MKLTIVLASGLTLAKGYTPKQKEQVGKINEAIKVIKTKFKDLLKKKSALLKAALPLKRAYRKTAMRGAPDKKLSAKLMKLTNQIDTINERTKVGRGKLAVLNKKLKDLRRAAGYKSGMVVRKKRKKLPPIPTKKVLQQGPGPMNFGPKPGAKPAAKAPAKNSEVVNFRDDTAGLSPQTQSVLSTLELHRIPTGNQKGRGSRHHVMEQIGENLHRFVAPKDLITVFKKSKATPDEIRHLLNVAGEQVDLALEDNDSSRAKRIDDNIAAIEEELESNGLLPPRKKLGDNSKPVSPKDSNPRIAELQKTIQRMEATLDDGGYDDENSRYSPFQAQQIINKLKAELKGLTN